MPEDTAEQTGAADRSPAAAAPGAITALGRTLSSVVEVGRDLLARRRQNQQAGSSTDAASNLVGNCRALLDHRGEASGLALASEVVTGYRALAPERRLAFFNALAFEFDVDRERVLAAADAYRAVPNLDNLWSIGRAVEAPRQKLFRRVNTAPDGTATLVEMRGHLLPLLKTHPELKGVDADLKELFISWFNKGFLELRRIDWSSPAAVLEKIIAYEAVHQINGWDDLRSRLGDDRRCFAFFHPALRDDPLVFVEIALTNEVPATLAPLLQQEREAPQGNATTVVFYSISNCHPGLSQISFGNFLIKSVVEELRKEIHSLDTFVTLSPVPGFRRWLLSADIDALVPAELVDRVREPVGPVIVAEVYDALKKLCAHYLLNVKSGRLPKDAVARFHLGNGAILHQLNSSADLSAKGREQSAGIMVNYLYDMARIEENHDAYFDSGKIAVSRAVTKLLET
ncbi:MAG: malonyl-CoA decarboxylase [Gammaproteobacteria bacterium]|jgi:malonyl-CoA decarboxylase|nr:malonyl-CoA decarboxylase [Gammaproteobacteria bacterium]